MNSLGGKKVRWFVRVRGFFILRKPQTPLVNFREITYFEFFFPYDDT